MRYPFRNIYHCCTIKSASQWFRALFDDRLVRRRTGLSPCHWREDLDIDTPLDEQAFKSTFPDKTTAVSLYISFPVFQSIPKPEPWRAFFVLRDPRDIVVSWYYSLKHSHPILKERMAKHRRHLQSVSSEEGLLYAIRHLCTPRRLTDVQLSWVTPDRPDERAKVCRYEDMFGPDEDGVFADLLAFLGIPLTSRERSALLRRFAFDRFSGGRERGKEDSRHHYRLGVAGSWKDEFTDRVKECFVEQTGDLIDVLGYGPTL